MEPLDNKKSSYLPSKRFLIRGGVATLIVALILLSQTNWFLSLFGKEKKGLILTGNETVGQIVGKDSNGNGIPDWEEQLWGLDPTKLSTNGVSHVALIKERRAQLQAEDSAPLNETDRLARELFSVATALGQSGVGTGEGLDRIGQEIGKNTPTPNTTPHYALSNIRTVTTTGAALVTYKRDLTKILRTYSATLPEIELIIESIETGNTDQLATLNKTVAYYRSLSSQLLSLKVPQSISGYHLDMTNSAYGLANAFEKMTQLEDNSIVSLVGFAEYRYFTEQMDSATGAITTFLSEYDIL